MTISSRKNLSYEGFFCQIVFSYAKATSFNCKEHTHISNLLLPLRNDSSHSIGRRSQNVYLLRNVFSCCHLLLNGFFDDLSIIQIAFNVTINNSRYQTFFD